MARTIGAVGKARYVGVSMDKLRETFGDKAIIYVSIEHHGAMLGVDRDSAPRTKTVMLGAEVASVSVPVAPVTTEITISAKPPAPKEKAEAQIIDVSEY